MNRSLGSFVKNPQFSGMVWRQNAGFGAYAPDDLVKTPASSASLSLKAALQIYEIWLAFVKYEGKGAFALQHGVGCAAASIAVTSFGARLTSDRLRSFLYLMVLIVCSSRRAT